MRLHSISVDTNLARYFLFIACSPSGGFSCPRGGGCSCCGCGGRSGLANKPFGDAVHVPAIFPSLGVVICTIAPSFLPLQSS